MKWPHLRIRHSKTVLASSKLRWLSWGFLLLGVALVGFVTYSMVDAKLFQAYESRRFNQAGRNVRPWLTPGASEAMLPPGSRSAELQREPIVQGDVLGKLEIARIGIAVVVVEGIDTRALRRSVGHIPGTALPGAPGNIAIAGHRDTYFRHLKSIRPNDQIQLQTASGVFRYEVDWVRVVAPTDISVLTTSTEPTLTLVTCYPFEFLGPAPQRFVVHAHKQ